MKTIRMQWVVIILSVLVSGSLLARSGTGEKYRVLQPKGPVTGKTDESPTTNNSDQGTPPGDYPDTPPGSSGGSQNDSESEGSHGTTTSGPLQPPPDPVPDPNNLRF